ncbi:MAG: T9SS type A sorting domain-containing protein [Muribaculaceae bacterium]|nr:T9SS type A sorting domain-containing protein [Muribaculaceae bacterium]
MNKITSFTLSVLAMATASAQAQDFTVLTTPEEVYLNSTEDVEGAKATFQSVLDNAEATDADKTAAMQAYVQNATPAPGYAFDMTFLMAYTAINADNYDTYTQAKLAEAYRTDLEGVTFGESNSPLQRFKNEANGEYMRIADNSLKSESSYNVFAVYQTVNLSKGAYVLQGRAFVAGKAAAANLAAGETLSAAITGSPLKDYSVNFTMPATEDIKLGFVRNDLAGGLTQIAFNNLELYKVSDVVAITDDATGPLAAATDANVRLDREFKAGEYVPVCLPFSVVNWREVFDDLLVWTNYADDELVFSTLAGANTQARKPYLAKMKNDVTANDYLMFRGVTIQSGNAGSWIKSVAEGEEAFPVKMVGNWAAGTVPAGCYYLADGAWYLSDGTAPLTAFSAYIDATALTEKPEVIAMNTGNGSSSIINNASITEPTTVNVYNLQGMMVKSGVSADSALEGLPAGLYIVNNKKIVKY